MVARPVALTCGRVRLQSGRPDFSHLAHGGLPLLTHLILDRLFLGVGKYDVSDVSIIHWMIQGWVFRLTGRIRTRDSTAFSRANCN